MQPRVQSESDAAAEEDLGSSEDLFTPDTETFEAERQAKEATAQVGKIDAAAAEMHRVKQELEAAKSVIKRQEQELAETRTLKHTMDQAMGPPSEADFSGHADISEQAIGNLQSAFNASARPFTSRNDVWGAQEDPRSARPGLFSNGTFGQERTIWHAQAAPAPPVTHASFPSTQPPVHLFSTVNIADGRSRALDGLYTGPPPPPEPAFQPAQRIFSGPPALSYPFDGRAGNAVPHFAQPRAKRGVDPFRSSGSNFTDVSTPYGSYPPGIPGLSTTPLPSLGFPNTYGQYPGGIGTPLSAMAGDLSASLPLPSVS